MGRPKKDPLIAARTATAVVLAPDERAELYDARRIDAPSVCPRSRGWILAGCRGCGAGAAYPRGCGRMSCPWCTTPAARARAKRLYKSYGGADLAVWVVTLQPGWVPRLSKALAGAIEEAVWGALRGCYLDYYGVELGARQYWHPCGDVCRNCGISPKEKGYRRGLGDVGACMACGAISHAHPHLNFLIPLHGAIQKNGVWSGKTIGIEGYLPPIRLEVFVSRVAEALQQLGAQLGLEDYQRQIHYQYRKTPEQKRHAFRYFSRPFPAWQEALKTLKSGRRWGLAAARATEESDAWRLNIRGDKGEAKTLQCPCCSHDLTVWGQVRASYGRLHQVGADVFLTVAARTRERRYIGDFRVMG